MKGGISSRVVAGMSLGVVLLAACGREEASRAEPHPAPAITRAAEARSLTRVESVDHVCMVTNRLFAGPQIPVKVGDAVYYGCCEGCKAKLAGERASREGVDPVSGRSVDKAKAVIGALPDGRVIYFESVENLEAWTPAVGGIPPAG